MCQARKDNLLKYFNIKENTLLQRANWLLFEILASTVTFHSPGGAGAQYLNTE